MLASNHSNRLQYYGLIALLLINTIEGVLRYVLLGISLEKLLYAKDAVALGLVFWSLWDGFHRRSYNKPLIAFLVSIITWGVVSFFYVHNALQTAFAIKLLLPIMVGMVSGPALFNNGGAACQVLMRLWLVSVTGLLFSAAITVPWAGLSYEVAGIAIEGTRAWTIDSVERLAGFGRASTEVSCQILFFAIFVVCYGRKRWLSVLVWVASGPLIVLATTRSVVLAYAILSVFFCANYWVPSLQLLWKQSLTMMMALMIALPLIPEKAFGILASLKLGGVAKMDSLLIRVEETWPEALNLLKSDGSFIIGRGIGGIAVAQKLFEPDAYNPGDNLFIFLLLVFGSFAFLILAAFLARLLMVNLSSGNTELFTFSTGLAIISIGTLLNGIENLCEGVFLGLALSAIPMSRKRRLPRSTGRTLIIPKSRGPCRTAFFKKPNPESYHAGIQRHHPHARSAGISTTCGRFSLGPDHPPT